MDRIFRRANSVDILERGVIEKLMPRSSVVIKPIKYSVTTVPVFQRQ